MRKRITRGQWHRRHAGDVLHLIPSPQREIRKTAKAHCHASFRCPRAVDKHHDRNGDGRLLPASLQVHVARIPLLSSGGEAAKRSRDEDVDYQARLLGHAGVEVVTLMQTAASLSADSYDDRITRRMRDASGVPAITSAGSIGLAVRALGARRIALVAPFPMATVDRLGRYFAIGHSLEMW
jgi:hypothetical protein